MSMFTAPLLGMSFHQQIFPVDSEIKVEIFSAVLPFLLVMGDTDTKILDTSIPGRIALVSSLSSGIENFSSEYNHTSLTTNNSLINHSY